MALNDGRNPHLTLQSAALPRTGGRIPSDYTFFQAPTMSEFAFDVSIQDFEAKVLRIQAETVPVVVDFLALWCELCKVLKPMLGEAGPRKPSCFVRPRSIPDENPELAQHFGVRSIPSVKVLFQGQLSTNSTVPFRKARFAPS